MKKTDISTPILVIIAVVGILTSAFFLMRGQFNKNTNREDSDRIATISHYEQDIRLKMAGDLHWYPVNQEVSCFSEDTIFTGPNSKATLDLVAGGSLTLYPNTLVTLRDGRISLDSGSLEINLTKGQVEIESFGEVFKVTPQEKIKIENTEKIKRIIPLAESKVNNPIVKNYIEKIQITLDSPTLLEKIPKISESTLEFKWSAQKGNPQSQYLLEISNEEDFKNILFSKETSALNHKLASDLLPSGPIFWRVSQGETREISSFLHLDKFTAEQIHPEDNKTYSLEQNLQNGLNFEWTNPLGSPVKLEVSQLEDFSQLTAEENLSSTIHEMNLKEKGRYFWRVGYLINNNMHWSKVSTFILEPDLKTLPLILNKIPNKLDFSLRKSFDVRVLEPTEFDRYEFILGQGDKIIDRRVSHEPTYKLKHLPDGQYQLSIKASNKSKRIEGEIIKELNVLTSPPIEAPKLKNKEKVKLLVKIFKTVLNNLFPSAHAASKFFYNLEWESVPNATYEIEIYKNNKEELHLNKILRESKFRLNISGPEVYYWRVRTILHGKRGPFSEFAQIQIEDRVFTLNQPLMLSPRPDESLSIIENGTVTFTWQEPISGKYYLEYSTRPDGRNKKRIPVSRGSKTLKFKKAPSSFYWRIHAESLYGNSNPNEERYKLNLEVIENKFPFSKVLTRLALHQSNSQFKIKAKDADLKENLNMSGQIMDLDLEFFPQKARQNSLNIAFRGITLSDSDNKLDEKRLGLEYGRLLNPNSNAHQQFYLGYHYLLQYSFQLDSTLQGDYTAGFLSARYLFRRHLTEKLNLELSSHLQMPTAFDFTPSVNLRPAINYRLNAKWWVDFYLMYERFYTRPEIENGGPDAEITLQNMALGLGLTWNPNNAPF